MRCLGGILAVWALAMWPWAAAAAPAEDKAPPDQPVVQSPLTASEMSVSAGKRKVPLKILDAVRLGLEKNVTIRKGILDRATQRGDLELAERYFEPRVFLNGVYRYLAQSQEDQRGGGLAVVQRLMTAGRIEFRWEALNTLDREQGDDRNQSTLGLTLTQPLLRGAGITVGTSEVVTARYQEAQNLQSFRALIMDRISDIQRAYWDLLLALQFRLSTVRSLEASKELLKRNKVLISAGRMAPADLVQTEQEVARNRVSLLEQEFRVQAANRALVDLLDLDSDVAILPVEGFTFHRVEVDYPRMQEAALAHNPQLLSARVRVEQAQLSLELAESSALDQLDLTLQTSKTATEGSLGQTADDSLDVGSGWTAGLSLAIPLGLPRDQLQHEVLRSRRELEKARMDLSNTRRQTTQLVRDRVNDVNRSLLQIELAQRSRELALQKYNIERTRLELGRSTNFQVLSFQRDLVSAADQEHQAIANYLNSLAALDRAAGSTLDTWRVRVQTPEPPSLPTIGLRRQQRPRGIQLAPALP